MLARLVRDQATASARVVDMVRAYPDPAVINWSEVDVDSFLFGCDANRVACLLGPTLAATNESPVRAVERFRMVELRGKFARARMARDLALVSEAFTAADVPWVVLKGPALVVQVYRDGPRESSDLDLLVDGRHLEAALDALTGRGATLIDRNFDLLRAMGSGEIAIELPNGTIGDLHWHPIHERRVRERFAVDVNQMLQRRELVTGSPTPVPTLDATDSVLYLCLHACLSGGERLLWTKDIDLAVRRLGWSADELTRRAEAMGIGLPAAAMLARTTALMRTPMEPALLANLAGAAWWLIMLRLADRLLSRRGTRNSSLLRLMYRCTRGSSTASAREFVRACVYNSLLRRRADPSRPWRIKAPGGEHPASVDSAPQVRDLFFDDVRSETNQLSA